MELFLIYLINSFLFKTNQINMVKSPYSMAISIMVS